MHKHYAVWCMLCRINGLSFCSVSVLRVGDLQSRILNDSPSDDSLSLHTVKREQHIDL